MLSTHKSQFRVTWILMGSCLCKNALSSRMCEIKISTHGWPVILPFIHFPIYGFKEQNLSKRFIAKHTVFRVKRFCFITFGLIPQCNLSEAHNVAVGMWYVYFLLWVSFWSYLGSYCSLLSDVVTCKRPTWWNMACLSVIRIEYVTYTYNKGLALINFRLEGGSANESCYPKRDVRPQILTCVFEAIYVASHASYLSSFILLWHASIRRTFIETTQHGRRYFQYFFFQRRIYDWDLRSCRPTKCLSINDHWISSNLQPFTLRGLSPIFGHYPLWTFWRRSAKAKFGKYDLYQRLCIFLPTDLCQFGISISKNYHWTFVLLGSKPTSVFI